MNPMALLNTLEAAKVLRLGTATLWRWRKQGRGPAVVRMGHKIYYRPADLERWVEEQTQPPSNRRGEMRAPPSKGGA